MRMLSLLCIAFMAAGSWFKAVRAIKGIIHLCAF